MATRSLRAAQWSQGDACRCCGLGGGGAHRKGVGFGGGRQDARLIVLLDECHGRVEVRGVNARAQRRDGTGAARSRLVGGAEQPRAEPTAGVQCSARC